MCLNNNKITTDDLADFILKFWEDNENDGYSAYHMAHEILNFLYWNGVIGEY